MEYKGEHGKHQPDDSKHPIYDSKSFFGQTDDSKHSVLQNLWWLLKKSKQKRLENMIFCQLKIGEGQATCGGLIQGEFQ